MAMENKGAGSIAAPLALPKKLTPPIGLQSAET